MLSRTSTSLPQYHSTGLSKFRIPKPVDIASDHNEIFASLVAQIFDDPAVYNIIFAFFLPT